MRQQGAAFGSRQGSQLVEAGLVILPFFALAFMTMDAAWGLFVKATLQHAVSEGVRYAVTGQVSAGRGQVESIKAVVVNQAMGFLSGSQAGTLSVTFLNQSTLAPTASNVGGNLVQVAVTNYSVAPLAPLLRASSATLVTVMSADRMEGSPGGVPPTP